MDNALGRIKPADRKHIDLYKLSDVMQVTPVTVETILDLPVWHGMWNQGREGACVGFGTSMMNAILKLHKQKQLQQPLSNLYFDPFWLWNEAKTYDDDPDTNPGDGNGTTVRAACDVLRNLGDVVQNTNGVDFPVDPAEGIAANRWAVTIDEVRLALSQSIPCSIGVDWYTNFDNPQEKNTEFWIGEQDDLGTIRGGHCVCVFGASDQRQAVLIKNSWGKDYPLVWMPYKTLQKLLDDEGECTLVTDR